MDFQKRFLVVSICMTTLNSAQADEPLQLPGMVIDVLAGSPQVSREYQSMEAIQASPTADAGELLRSINGVSGIRMGGRGIDPLIRGQSQTQLNVLLGGGYIHGGCPNRMDPPTSYASVGSYDSVTVIKGNHTVRYGGGGSGGTVLFEREWPEFDADREYRGEVSAGYHENGNRWQVGADIAAGSEQGYIRYLAHQAESDNYEDGSGNEVRSSYESQSHTLIGGVRLGEQTLLEASYEQTREEDVLFAGAGMDSPYADADNYRLSLEHEFSGEVMQSAKAEFYRSDVAHNMDNFSLRSVPAGKMPMEAPSTSDTDGIRLTFEAFAAGIDWVFGADLQRNQRNATQLLAMNGAVAGIQWPDVTIEQAGLFLEGDSEIGAQDRLRAGVRYDRVSAEADRANEIIAAGSLMGRTPEDIYGVSAQTNDEHNVGGFISWTHLLNRDLSLETTLSRSVRTADATERFMATSMWVGNPQLKPEQHHQLEIALAGKSRALSWHVVGWYNAVEDYILRQQSGMVTSYRNVDATLYGAELAASLQLSPAWALSSELAWVEGENTTDDTPLSQISPLSLTNTLSWEQGNRRVGLEWRLANDQDDVCLFNTSCGGMDARATPGYSVLNLYGEYRLDNGLTLTVGVDNLFDRDYSYHESRNDVFDPQPVQVAEPGQSFWLKLSARF